MKAKPNTDQFKIKKDPSAFLEGGQQILLTGWKSRSKRLLRSKSQSQRQRL